MGARLPAPRPCARAPAAQFGGFQPKGPLQRLMARALPREVLHALANDPSIYDQDVVIMESQVTTVG